MSKGLEQCDKCDYFISVEDAYKQGRADAIDECISKLDNLYSIAESSTKYPQYDHYCNGIEDCIDMLEQLKEQK